jgi:hypothetical protein
MEGLEDDPDLALALALSMQVGRWNVTCNVAMWEGRGLTIVQ